MPYRLKTQLNQADFSYDLRYYLQDLLLILRDFDISFSA